MPPPDPATPSKGTGTPESSPSSDVDLSQATTVLKDGSAVTQFLTTAVEGGLAIKKTWDAYNERELLRQDKEKEKALTQSVEKIRTEHTALDTRIKKYERELESPETDPMRASALRTAILPGLRSRRDEAGKRLNEEVERLKELQTTDRLEVRMAQESVGHWESQGRYEEGAGVTKSLLQSAKASTAFVGEGAKLAAGGLGIAAGGAMILVSGKDLVKDVSANREALKLRNKAAGALGKDGINDGIKKDDVELRAIAKRMLLKQQKNSVNKGLSATKNAFGVAGGAGSIMAGVAAAGLAGGALLTPVGWGLAGAGAVAALGYCGYKLYRNYESSQIKQALQQTLKTLGQKLDVEEVSPKKSLGELKKDKALTKDEISAMDRVADKVVKEQAKLGNKINRDDVTLEQLQEYTPRKLLSRDTGMASDALYVRFKKEVDAHFKGEAPTKEGLEQYLKTEAAKQPVDSAVGLMSKLGVGLKAEEALDLYHSKADAGIKFLQKKIYTPEKEEPAKKLSVRDMLRGGSGLGKTAPSQQQSVGRGSTVRDNVQPTKVPLKTKGASIGM